MEQGPLNDGSHGDDEARVHRVAYGALLRMYPRPFVARYGPEMTELFVNRLERARRVEGRFGVGKAWVAAVWDTVRGAFAERTGDDDGGKGSRRVEISRNRGAGIVETLWQDIRYSIRRLVRTPVFSLVAIAIVAVGIGANAAAFSLVDTLIFRPPPYQEPDRVLRIFQDSDEGSPNSSSFPAFQDMAATEGVFSGVAATSAEAAAWDGPDGPTQASVEYATSALFPVFGLTPSRGRWFGPEHDEVGQEMVAVVSDRTWRGKLGSDPGIVGSVVRLNGHPVTVIGVGPRSYNGMRGALVTDFWLSVSSTPVGGDNRVANLDRREDHWYDVFARLAPGISKDQAQVAMDQLAGRLAAEFPELNQGREITVFGSNEVSIHPSVDAGVTALGIGLLAVVGLVLLLACSNLANLLLVRGVSRSAETAVRQALGAGATRVARLFFVESLLLSVVGGLAGLGLATWLVQFGGAVPLPTPGGMELDMGIDGRVLTFGMLLAVMTGVLFGLTPALRAMRPNLSGTLRDEGRSASSGRSTAFLRNGLVAVQVAVSVTLVIAAGLLVRSLANVSGVEVGVDVDRVAFVSTNLQQAGVSQEEAPVVMDEIVSRVAAIPGVSAVSLTSRLPVQGGGSTTTVVEDYEPPSGTGSVELPLAVADGAYPGVFGVQIVDGRWFSEDDVRDAPVAVVVNQTAARQFWGGDAVGRRLRPQGSPDAWREVVGVVTDVKVGGLDEGPTPMIYLAAEQFGLNSFAVVARTEGDPSVLPALMKGELRAVRDALPVSRSGTLQDHLGEALAGPRAATGALALFSVLAILLAALGIYGVVSFSVARRSGEMGIRAALGAGSRGLVRMVVRESMLTVAVGVLFGVAIAVVAAIALDDVLVGIPTLDPMSFMGGAFLFAGVAAVASWLPARRAAGANPMDVLRGE